MYIEEQEDGFEKLVKHFHQTDETLVEQFSDLAMVMLYQVKAKPMNTERYKTLMEEISVIYYDENRHQIITGHKNGSICIWS